MRANRMLVLIGGMIFVIGSRLPWMSAPVLFDVEGTVFEAIEIGWEDNGFITGGIGLILLLVGILWRGRIEKDTQFQPSSQFSSPNRNRRPRNTIQEVAR